MSKIKIVFSGIGAVGGYYGGLLAERYGKSDEVEVIFVAHGENLKSIKEKGLRIKTPLRKVTVHPALATDKPEEIGTADYLFCCKKNYDLEDSIKELKPAIGKNTVIIPLLNGADVSERIQAMLPGQNVWKGCVYIGARMEEAGFIQKFTLKDDLYFGLDGKDKERQQELLSILTKARVYAHNPDNMETEIWKKFMRISTAATLTSFLNRPINEVVDNYQDLYIALGTELRSLAEAKGVKLPDDIIYSTIEGQKKMPKNTSTSMHADFLKGHQTEVETLTGYVVREAEKAGLEVPTYKFMYNGLVSLPYPVE